MTTTTVPAPALLTDPITRWAAAQPDVPCVSYQDQNYTWAQWAERLQRVSGALRLLGIVGGNRVATIDMNNLATVEVTNGAAAIGAAHVIVNFRLFGDQLAYVLADSAPRVVFVGADVRAAYDAIADRVPSVEKVIVLGGGDDEFQDWVAAGEPEPTGSDVTPDHVCLVMYSSGTTGFPKGVELTHHNMNVHSAVNNEYFRLAPGEVSLAAMPLLHVGGTSYIALGMHHGASTVMLREVLPGPLLGAIVGGVTRLFLVPAVVAQVLAAGEQAIGAFSKLEVFAYGASPMPLPMLQKALASWPEMDFVQVYGMTETGGVITSLSPLAHRDPEHPERLTSAGEVVAGGQVRVVDPATGEDCAVGQVGALWFHTPQLMKGYLGKPEACAQAW